MATKFDFTGATYGRAANTNKFVVELKNSIKKTTTDLTGTKYNEILAAIEENWSGADADKFKKQFKDAISNLQKKYKEYDKIVEQAFKDDADSFLKMQNNNASLFSTK